MMRFACRSVAKRPHAPPGTMEGIAISNASNHGPGARCAAVCPRCRRRFSVRVETRRRSAGTAEASPSAAWPWSLQSRDQSRSLDRTSAGAEGQTFDPRITPPIATRAVAATILPFGQNNDRSQFTAAMPMPATIAKAASDLCMWSSCESSAPTSQCRSRGEASPTNRPRCSVRRVRKACLAPKSCARVAVPRENVNATCNH